MSEAGLRLRLALSRPDFELDVDLGLPAVGISVLFGPSGSGKTTVLRCVAGLESTVRGSVRVGNEVWLDSATGIRLPVWRRNLGYVFQEASLFEHLDVRRNVEYGLRRTTTSRDGGDALQAAIELLGIGHLMARPVAQLSGGERQRVAIVRALATRPRLLLLDEPMAGLDYARRQDIMPWLERMRDELSIPMLYVTHSVDEVARLADQVVALDAGKVSAAGPAGEVLASLEGPVVGSDDAGSLVHAQIAERDHAWHLARAEFEGGHLWVVDAGHAVGKVVRLRVLARDVSIQLHEPAGTSVQNQLPAVIESIAEGLDGAQSLVRLRCGSALLLARLTRRSVSALELTSGKAVWAQVKAVAVTS
ncbi:MAG TPA: molybdenum ABC transporter ATP-binding protein [Steroidobacteraceae bacterium]|nr:molybdenum ABC transporter ATP-binding protein [Steroidobacteraceae bacterium]